MVDSKDEIRELEEKVNRLSYELEKHHAVQAQNNKWMLVVGAVIMAALGYTSLIQLPKEAAEAAKNQIGPEIVNEAQKIVSRLQSTNTEANGILERLRSASETTIQPRALSFFADGECPKGWAEYTKASGRFLLASGAGYNFESTGGLEKVALKEPEMPSHNHQNATRGSHSNKEEVWALLATDKGNYGSPHGRPTDSKGSGKPHENMPPYIALTLCQKD